MGTQEPETIKWDSITADAHKLVYGDRQFAYAHPVEDWTRTVDIFRAITNIEMTPEEGALFMAAVKLSRIAYGLEQMHPAELVRDSVVDLAGYAEVLWGIMIYEPEDDTEPDDDYDE
jgi:hypothetical protein